MANRLLFQLFPMVCLSLLSCLVTAAEIDRTSSVALGNSSQHFLYSETISQNFQIDVAMPPELLLGATEEYPVVYILDGNSMFPMVYSNARALQGDLEMAPTIFVGIGYATKDTLERAALRNRDLTPTYDEAMLEMLKNRLLPLPIQVDPGGARNFIEFIENEVKPFINQNFPTDSNNETLAGYSFGGLFGLYVLFNHTDSFDKYVLGSPSIWWDEKVSLSYESTYANSHSDLDKSVFLSNGSLESNSMKKDGLDLYNSLLSRNYGNLQISYLVLEGETHTSGIGVSLNRGLKAVFLSESEEFANLFIEKIMESRQAN